MKRLAIGCTALLVAVAAWGQVQTGIDDGRPVPMGATAVFSLYFTQPGTCSKTTGLYCIQATDCPPGEGCRNGAPITPTTVTCRTDDADATHVCNGGANAGLPCVLNGDCPSGTCAGLLDGPTTFAPSAPAFRYSAGAPATAAAGHRVTSCTWPWPDGVCVGGVCQGRAVGTWSVQAGGF